MNLEMVFNELSILPPNVDDIPTAQQRMSELVKTLRMATVSGFKRVLRADRTNKQFQDIILAPDYPIARWRNDHQVDKETRLFFTALTIQSPLLAEIQNPEIESEDLHSEARFEDQLARGLGIAYLIDGLAISFNTSPKWNISQLELQILRLEDNGEDIVNEVDFVHHASSSTHIQENTDWIKARLEGDDLWLRNGLPKNGASPYNPSKAYDPKKSSSFPTKLYRGSKVFIDDKDQLWLWDKQEKHWDVQFKPYGLDNYFRVSSDGRLLD
ncbi:MAG: hypothetical protein HC875_26330 [Anaerolineales bacterium]|nr:hypothetical protein [Anaerolineales bacterium]